MEEQTNSLGESAAVDAIANLLGGPDDPVPPIEDEHEEEAAQENEGEESTTEDSEETTQETQEEELEEITWNAETKKVSKSELKELAQKGFDYTQKTQELATQRKQFEAVAQAKAQEFQLMQTQVDTLAQVKSIDSQLDQFKGINWQQLAGDDPVQYLQLKQSYDSLKEVRVNHLQTMQQQTAAIQQTQAFTQQQFLAEQAKELTKKLPEVAKAENKAALRDYLLSNGYSEQDVAGVADHKAVVLAWKAMQFDKLQSSKPALTKRVAETPKVVKSGTPKVSTPQATKDNMAALKKTGRGEYAAKLIESMI
jgi:hypothetical protein